MTSTKFRDIGPEHGLTLITLTVFLPFAGGYFLSYFSRSVNALIAPPLISEIGLTAGDLGFLTSASFLAFAAIQIPLGILLDRFGPRRVQSTLLLGAALGAFLFSMGETQITLIIGRALIGLGVAGGLMASLKAITMWYPQNRWPLVNGCFMAMGGLGAMAATAPMELALTVTDWRHVFVILSGTTVAVSLIIFLVVPERKGLGSPASLKDQIRGVGSIFSNALFWKLVPLAMTTLAATMAIQSLWAGPWFKDIGGIDQNGVASNLLFLAFIMTVGFIGTGVIADYLTRRNVSLKSITVWGIALCLVAQLAVIFEIDPQGFAVWVLFGLTMNVGILVYPQLIRHFPLTHTGRANTAVNLLTFGWVFITQYGMGEIIDLWPTGPDGGYHPDAYRASFGTFLALQFIAIVWFMIPTRKN